MDVDVGIDLDTSACACCGKSNLKRTIRIAYEDGEINLGVKCAGDYFNLNLTGNPYKAAAKLNKEIDGMSENRFYGIIDGINQ